MTIDVFQNPNSNKSSKWLYFQCIYIVFSILQTTNNIHSYENRIVCIENIYHLKFVKSGQTLYTIGIEIHSYILL